MSDKLISTRQAAKILGVSVSTVSRWFDQKILAGEKNPLTSWRKVSMESIEKILKNFNLPLPIEPKKEETLKEVDEKHDTN
jgi:transposase